jgi:hypothetical protein
MQKEKEGKTEGGKEERKGMNKERRKQKGKKETPIPHEKQKKSQTNQQ